MLSFDASLSNALNSSNSTAFWVCKLYYNDDSSASNYIGVSDIDRLDGSDMYYGLRPRLLGYCSGNRTVV